jgi:hypothetical protein
LEIIMDKIYPPTPKQPNPDLWELIEPLNWLELECTCNPDPPEGTAILCPACKQYFEEKYGLAIPFMEGEL